MTFRVMDKHKKSIKVFKVFKVGSVLYSNLELNEYSGSNRMADQPTIG